MLQLDLKPNFFTTVAPYILVEKLFWICDLDGSDLATYFLQSGLVLNAIQKYNYLAS